MPRDYGEPRFRQYSGLQLLLRDAAEQLVKPGVASIVPWTPGLIVIHLTIDWIQP